MSVSPGWYPDPAAPHTQRFWDGEQWVGGPVPVGETPPAEPPPAPPVLAQAWPEDPPAATAESIWNSPAHPAPAEAGQALTGSGQALASPGQRLLARIIDIAIVAVLVAVVNAYFFRQYFQEVSPQVDAFMRAMTNGQQVSASAFVLSDRARRLAIIMSVLAVALWFAYEVPSHANRGQTIGKRVVGIRVARLDGRRVTFWTATKRWLVLALPSVVLSSCIGLPFQLVDVLWCVWDRPLRQCLHDKFASTAVVVATASVQDPALAGASPGDVPGPGK
jgi:uncharacterized RDD family membrane protein YckC